MSNHPEPNGKYQVIIQEAKEASDYEHEMSIFECIRRYPKAIGWSVLASTGLVMEGYDGVMIGSFYGYRMAPIKAVT
jgi:SP family general alpha glucoside:H+ symporter-like MFS transporter